MDLKLAELFSGMFSDELDRMGYRDQVVTGYILNRSEHKCFGKVRTVQLETVETPDENIELGLGFLENLQAGDILCVSGSEEFAYFGELMSRLSIRQGVGGVIIDGLTRDSSYTQSVDELAIFSRGYSPKDIKGRGRVAEVDVPITIQGKLLRPDDWVFGDSDGIVICPIECREELLNRVRNVLSDETDIIERLNRGESISKILKFHTGF